MKKSSIRVGAEPSYKFSKTLLHVEFSVEYENEDDFESQIKRIQDRVNRLATNQVVALVQGLQK